jgi:hypothetical protein
VLKAKEEKEVIEHQIIFDQSYSTNCCIVIEHQTILSGYCLM